MELFAEMKCMGDGYAGGFSCGMTMHASQTMERFTKRSGEEDLAEGQTVYSTEDGLRLTVKKTKDGDALRIETTVLNEGTKPVTLEMLTSFALRGVVADKVHRMQSFWSSEGKLR
ncbi:MAG: alpha-galactosidase, partial [Lachnospiraceae bacterium]|nr:alpha-galactosidase [Lachnospiraceae bacterium]